MFKFYTSCSRILFISFILLGNFSFSFAQLNETRFYDTVTKVSHEGRVYSGISDGPYMYLAGASFSETSPLPTLTKVDTSGTVIWTATTHDKNEHFYAGTTASCKSTFKSGNRIYTIAEGDYWSPPPRIEIWCISDSSGEVLWRSSFNQPGLKIVDYSPTELVLLSGETNGVDSLRYDLIDKTTGKVTFHRSLGVPDYLFHQNKPDILVDDHQNILISINDTCKKFRDKYLTQLQWNSRINPNGFLKMVDKILQDSARYILLGNSYARAVDSATGNTIWYRDVPVGQMLPFQTGAAGRPKDVLIKDSLLYITWVSPFVGSVNLKRGFTLTRINTQVGTIRFNVAYDFNGIPPDATVPSEEDLDWPMAMTMDSSNNIYLTGSYDYGSGPENPSNWGIMKINGNTGANIYESTITLDSTQRLRYSQGRFLHYYNGKMYCAGNAQKNYNILYTLPLLVSFDTISAYHEQFRLSPHYGYRFYSSLMGLTAFSNQKMALLKKLGQSSVVELRDINNQLIWSKSFSSKDKYVVPQNFKNLGDTGIAASFIIYTKDTINLVMQGLPDSILFVRLDSTGTTAFQRKLKINSTDTTVAYQIYSDKTGKTNFVYLRKGTGNGSFDNNGFMLNGAATGMGIFGLTEIRYFRDIPKIRITRFQHYNGDTLVYYHSNEIGSPSRNTGFLFSATQSAASTYAYFGSKFIRDFTKIYSVLKLDSASFFITGKSETGTIIGARFNRTLPNSWVWSRISPYVGNMFNADTSASSIYCVSEKTGNILYLSKLNKVTSSQAWDFERAPQPNKSTATLDLKYNNIAQNFTVAGYINDSTSESPLNTYFYITLDSSGNIVKDVTRTGIGVGETRINVLEALQNGTNAYGGSLATSDLGTVGFYNADCFASNITPSVSISTPSTTICVGSAVTFTAAAVNGGTTPVYQWQVNGLNAGTNSNIFTTSSLNNNDQVKVILTSNANCLLTPTAISNIITMTVTAVVTATVSISADQTSICSGTTVTFTATPVNGGSTPSYQWQVNGVNAGSNSNIFTSSSLNNNDQIKVILTSSLSCATPATVTSNIITMTVTPALTAQAGNDTVICAGSSVQLHGSGGTVYVWTPAAGLSNPNIANPVATPLITTAYILTVSNGGSCSAKDTVLITVMPSVTSSVSIATANNNICSGVAVTFTATPVNGGSAPSYQWQVNGVNAGTNSNTFTTSTLTNNAQIKVIFTSSLSCALPSTATSNIITITVTPLPIANAGNDVTICTGSSTQLQASGGTTYAWTPVAGLSNPNIANPVANPAATITYTVIVSNGTCSSNDAVVVSVSASAAPAVNISTVNTNICFGTAATFTANPTNGGSNPAYQWQVNGINVGSNSNTFTSNSLTNNSQVKVILTSNSTCVTTTTASSNIITMSVTQLATPLVSVGNRVFTVTNPDATASYTWQILTNGSWVNIIPAATGTTYTAPAAGEYRVKAVKGTCIVYSIPTVTNIVSPLSHFIYLRPNPASQFIRLDSINLSKKYETVEIIDMQAKRVLPLFDVKNQVSISIDISSLSNGTYMAIIRQRDGTYAALKFIKQ